MKPYIQSCLFVVGIIALSLLNLTSSYAGVGAGGGGDASEARVDEIRADILKWIGAGGAQALTFPQQLTYESYRSSMTASLAPHAVVVGFVTTVQENAASDLELKVSVKGQPKTCRGFVSKDDSMPHILCNTERFAAESEAKQYRLVHHEYAGLAGVEQNVGASSDYEISNQVTDYLVPETVLRLSVKKPAPKPRDAVKCTNFKGECHPSELLGNYKVLADQHWGVSSCPNNLLIEFEDFTYRFGPEPRRLTEYGLNTPFSSTTRDVLQKVEAYSSWIETKSGSVVFVRKTKNDLPMNQTFFGLFPNYTVEQWELIPTLDGNLQAVRYVKYAHEKIRRLDSNCLYERQAK